MRDRSRERNEMVATQLEARQIDDPRVLQAMREIPRELFVPDTIGEFAYHDTALPIEEGQTISQPYIVALMLEAMQLKPEDKVLEIGAGSGYQAALLGKLVKETYSVERHEKLVELAGARIRRLGLSNVKVVYANGTLGLPDEAPFDGIIVTAGGPGVPQPLLEQLSIGGRLVIPVGEEPTSQKLVRFVRSGPRQFDRTELCDVCFVPLIGARGWSEHIGHRDSREHLKRMQLARIEDVTRVIREAAEPLADLDSTDLTSLINRVGDARVVLLGAATHGTTEFYQMRSRITKELVLRRGFNIIAAEADWPDADRIDRYVRHRPRSRHEWRAFTRFPTWMWRNDESLELIEWLRAFNAERDDPLRRVGFYGLDLYALYTSAAAVIRYLELVDPEAAKVARERYGSLTPWESDPDAYGRAAIAGKYRTSESEVVGMLRDLFMKRMEITLADGERFLDEARARQLTAAAESYYRALYYGSIESWNLRDQHLFDTLRSIIDSRAGDRLPPKAIVWAHNSHAGDARATEMGIRGGTNLGTLCRRAYGEDTWIIGFGADRGKLTAASSWDGPTEVMSLNPALEDSYEHTAHVAGISRFILNLRSPAHENVRTVLAQPRLERAIGVIYRPNTERASHYFQASLADQFDEWIWFDETNPLRPLQEVQVTGVPETYPFGL